jgi:hypothetical protein
MNNRSIKLALPQAEVIELCRKDGVAIYSTEIVPIGCTRVYCKTKQGANELRRSLGEFVVN